MYVRNYYVLDVCICNFNTSIIINVCILLSTVQTDNIILNGIHMYIHTYVHMYVHVCMHECRCMMYYVRKYLHTYIHTYIHTYVRMYTCSYITYICMYVYVTGFLKTDHLNTFIVLRNINLKNSLSYNSAVVSSRSMGLALEIQHLFSDA